MRYERVTVDGGARSPDGRVTVHVLGSTDGVLVDPGGHSDELDAAVEAASVDHVLATHHHPDHVSEIARYADGATVWARAGRESRFTEASGVEPDRTFRPGTVLETPDGPLAILDTPGHTPEHVAIETPVGVVSGDLAVAEGSIVVGAPEGDMRAYLSSLRRLYARNPERLLPAHGPVIEEPRPTLERLVRHRLRRERKIAAAVGAGAHTVDDILEAAYEKDLTGVRDLARATVVAHLEKLAVEGRVDWDGTRATV